jgi:AmmeMemoRadiSam system protein A
MSETPEREAPLPRSLLLREARAALRRHLGLDASPAESPTDPALLRPAATFVTLRRREDGALRGCIGELMAYRPLVESLRANAVAAASRDPRFSAVTAEELEGLRVELSVLSDPAPVASPEEIRLGEHGVILRHGERRAVFLPEVATDQGWDRPTTLRALSRKAGLPLDAWRSPMARFEVFTSEKIKED